MIGSALTLKQLEALVWVADLGSFRKAAEHLNTTQPNISTRISSLETTFGFPLMQRDAGSVRMTPKGEAFLEQARLVLRAAEGLVEIAARPDLVDDKLRLGVTEMVACTWLRPFMRQLNERYPNISIELTVDLSRQLDVELAGNALDLAIQTAPFAAPATGSVELGSHDFVWVAAPDVAANLPDTPTEADLASHAILTHHRQTQAHVQLAERMPRARITASSSLLSCLHMAIDGMGLAAMPHAMVARHLAEGALVEIRAPWHPSPLRFAARFQRDRAPEHVAQAAQLAADCAAAFAADPMQSPFRE